MSIPLGYEGVLKYKIDGQDSGNPWIILANCADVKFPKSRNKSDVTRRASGKFKEYKLGHIDFSIDFDMLIDLSDQNFIDIWDASDSGDPIGVQFFLDDSETEGYQADMVVPKFEIDQAMDEGQRVAVSFCPTPSPTGTQAHRVSV